MRPKSYVHRIRNRKVGATQLSCLLVLLRLFVYALQTIRGPKAQRGFALSLQQLLEALDGFVVYLHLRQPSPAIEQHLRRISLHLLVTRQAEGRPIHEVQLVVGVSGRGKLQQTGSQTQLQSAVLREALILRRFQEGRYCQFEASSIHVLDC